MSGTERDVTVFLDLVDEDRERLNTGLILEGLRISRALGGRLNALRRSGDEPPVEEVAERTASLLAERGRPRLLLLADTDRGRELAPFLAHRAGTQALVGVTDIEIARAGGPSHPDSPPTIVYVKPVCGGQFEQEFSYRPGIMEVVTLARNALLSEAERGLLGNETVDSVTEVSSSGPSSGDRRKARVAIIPPDFHTVDIVYARRIVAGGVGVESPAALRNMEELAELLEASVATTRPMVDDGVFPKDRMIGQTGKTVSPDLYLALGVSGSPHHVAGFRAAVRVLAVNKDPRAPIFGFADAGWVADLGELLPHLVELIKTYRDAEGPEGVGEHGRA